jgi:thiaminase
MGAREILNEIRLRLEELNKAIINHQILRDAEAGKLKRGVLENFVINQWYIVNYDLRSLALGLSKSENVEELRVFKMLIDGDYNALNGLMRLMDELRINKDNPLKFNILPEAISYTHYILWLAFNLKPADFLFALIVNLPVWGEAVTSLGRALKEKYGIKSTEFFEVFKGPYDELEGEIIKVIDGKLSDKEILFNIGKTIQSYEKGFWDAIYSTS